MINFLKHIFKKHSHTAFAILMLILIISAIPDQDISTIPDVSAKTAQRVMRVGKLAFEGTGASYLEILGRYNGTKKRIFNIVVNDPIGEIKSFKWNVDNGPYKTALLTDSQINLTDGIFVKFEPKLDYDAGDNWTINTGSSARLNYSRLAITNTGRYLASFFGEESAFVEKNKDNIFAISSRLDPEGQAAFGEKALFDISISLTETLNQNRLWFLALLILAFVLVFLMMKRKKLIFFKKNSKKILVVEDEPDMRQALAEVLRKDGFQILEAMDGEQGFNLAISAKPDLILLDILMPKMDGMEMMKKLRSQNEWGRKVQIILLTNLSADEKIMQSIIQDEPLYYLVKSDWKISDVLDKVREVLNIKNL